MYALIEVQREEKATRTVKHFSDIAVTMWSLKSPHHAPKQKRMHAIIESLSNKVLTQQIKN
jgi:hypothetical protein